MKTLYRLGFFALLCCMSQLAQAAETIAVPNLDYKAEVHTFFYFEGETSRAKIHANNTNLNASADDTYVKTFHDNIHISYSELRGMAGDIRGLLIKNGFNVISTATHAAKPKQSDDFFNINKRIKAGEFKGAKYVLYGVVSSLDNQNGVEPIAGTNTQMNINAINMAVEFNLINTATLKTTAAFTVLASANDNKIGNGSNTPSQAKMVAALSDDLAKEVAEKLSSQDILPADALPLTDALSSAQTQPVLAGPVTVYQPDE